MWMAGLDELGDVFQPWWFCDPSLNLSKLCRLSVDLSPNCSSRNALSSKQISSETGIGCRTFIQFYQSGWKWISYRTWRYLLTETEINLPRYSRNQKLTTQSYSPKPRGCCISYWCTEQLQLQSFLCSSPTPLDTSRSQEDHQSWQQWQKEKVKNKKNSECFYLEAAHPIKKKKTSWLGILLIKKLSCCAALTAVLLTAHFLFFVSKGSGRKGNKSTWPVQKWDLKTCFC